MDRRSTTSFSIEIAAARLSFVDQELFRDLALTLTGGVFTCLLGPSGVGKTTLLRLIAGLAPKGATARVSCSDGKPLEGRLAYMAQQDLLLPWLSVRENLLLGSRLRRAPPDLERAHALLESVGLARQAGDRPATLSGGMRQRAALARTLMENRPVLLMDEPFAALDAITRHRLQTLAAQRLAGRTILLVTHDPMEALRLGERIIVMSGRPASLDEAPVPPGAIPRDPADPAIRDGHAPLLHQLERADREALG